VLSFNGYSVVIQVWLDESLEIIRGFGWSFSCHSIVVRQEVWDNLRVLRVIRF
jgi:hypothetical protein